MSSPSKSMFRLPSVSLYSKTNSASISIAAFVEPSDTIPADCAHQFALSVHKQRVSFAQQLENEMEEIQEQEHRKRVLEVDENNPDIKD